MDTSEEIKKEQDSVFDEFETERYSVSAGNGKRFLNLLVDTVSFYIVLIVFSGIAGILIAIMAPNLLSGLGGERNVLEEYVSGFVFGTLFYTLLEYFSGGRSLGKYLTKTRVVTLDGEKPSFKTCLIRSMCRYIPFEPFSFFGSTDCGWHDSISNTRVVEIEN